MEMKSQLLIGGGSLIGLVGLYFAWNYYSDNVVIIVTEKDANEKDVGEKEAYDKE